eukprot:GEMP01000693.1.p2 GENE.GEMP01000693.1~~GEMP01000693.1.p2  ORF type:complete len:705 (+),score=164.52 GEMP01000693.1:2934-5048(+)
MEEVAGEAAVSASLGPRPRPQRVAEKPSSLPRVWVKNQSKVNVTSSSQLCKPDDKDIRVRTLSESTTGRRRSRSRSLSRALLRASDAWSPSSSSSTSSSARHRKLKKKAKTNHRSQSRSLLRNPLLTAENLVVRAPSLPSPSPPLQNKGAASSSASSRRREKVPKKVNGRIGTAKNLDAPPSSWRSPSAPSLLPRGCKGKNDDAISSSSSLRRGRSQKDVDEGESLDRSRSRSLPRVQSIAAKYLEAQAPSMPSVLHGVSVKNNDDTISSSSSSSLSRSEKVEKDADERVLDEEISARCRSRSRSLLHVQSIAAEYLDAQSPSMPPVIPGDYVKKNDIISSSSSALRRKKVERNANVRVLDKETAVRRRSRSRSLPGVELMTARNLDVESPSSSPAFRRETRQKDMDLRVMEVGETPRPRSWSRAQFGAVGNLDAKSLSLSPGPHSANVEKNDDAISSSSSSSLRSEKVPKDAEVRVLEEATRIPGDAMSGGRLSPPAETLQEKPEQCIVLESQTSEYASLHPTMDTTAGQDVMRQNVSGNSQCIQEPSSSRDQTQLRKNIVRDVQDAASSSLGARTLPKSNAWVSEGLRVRILDPTSAWYRKKGFVQSVVVKAYVPFRREPAKQVVSAVLSIEGTNENVTVDQELLETVCGARYGITVRVVRGKLIRRVGTLVSKNVSKNAVSIFSGELGEISLSLDDVCEFL